MLRIDQITTDLCKARLITALHDEVGFSKQYSVEAFAETTGVDTSTLKNHLSGETLPRVPQLLRMFKVLGPSFTNRILRIAGLDAAESILVESVTDHELNANVASIIGTLGAALADGHIDHRERHEILKQAQHFLPILQDWIADNDRAPDDMGDCGGEQAACEEALNMRNQNGTHDA